MTCGGSKGDTAYLVLNASTGGGTNKPIFLDDEGEAMYSDGGVAISGIELNNALENIVTLGGKSGEVLVGNDASAKVQQVKRLPAASGTGRRSWLPLVD